MKRKIIFFIAALLIVPALVLGAGILIGSSTVDKDAENHFITGNILYKQSEYENAIKSYKKAVDINPLHEQAHSNLAYLYNKLEDYNKAAEHLAELIKINPANPSYHYDYAVNLMLNIKKTKKGEIEEIESALEEFKTAQNLELGYLHAKENVEFLTNMKNEYYSKLS